ncbi:hypothetical protein FACS1894106_1860 [Spirochaetia bacterium]|nr:hypothetical protein FACS1894106_1860 [Spirochaetia bacterium]
MVATQQPQMGLTFEQVWAGLMELRARQAETSEQIRQTEETVRANGVQLKDTVSKMAARVDQASAAVKEMAAKVDRVSENIGGVNQSMGELVETLISAKLWEKFDAYSYNFQRAYRRVELFDDTNRKRTDIDILLTNGEYAMAVEVKRHLDAKDDIDHHLKRMELIQKFPPNQCGGKKLLGAMAGGAVDTDILDYAHSAGLFVLELTGDSVRLATPPKEFKPRQW